MSAVFTDYLAETRFSETPLLDLMASRAMPPQKQHEISWAARLTDAAAGGRITTGPLTDDARGSLGTATLAIPDYYVKHQMPLIKRELIEAFAIGRMDIVKNLYTTEMDDAIRAMTLALDSALHAGVGTLNTTSFGIFGLTEIIKTTGSYAGISKTTNPRWVPIVRSGPTPGTPAALTIPRITAFERARRAVGASYGRNDGGRFLWLTSDEILTDTLRTLYKDQTVLNSDYERLNKDILPYSNYMINGAPVISDMNTYNTNRLTGLDLSKFSLHQFDDNGPAAMNDDKIAFFSYKGLQVRLAEVNRDHPDLITFELTCGCQLKCSDPIQGVSIINDVL